MTKGGVLSFLKRCHFCCKEKEGGATFQGRQQAEGNNF